MTMLHSWFEVNGCKHYVLNTERSKRLFFTDTKMCVESDLKTKHPFGVVYKPTGCIDTNIRFVIQPDKSVLIFNKSEWEKESNPFHSLELMGLKHDVKKFKQDLTNFFDGEADSK